MSKYSENIPAEIENTIGWFIKDIKPNSAVLDVGCSTGYYGSYIKTTRGAKVYGVEPSADREEARKVLDGLYSFDLDGEWPESINERLYDVIFLGDVIEHLKDPKRTLIKLKKILKQDGRIFISTPNIAHLSIRLELMGGNFEYESMGILDSTHLKYFTLRSLKDLVGKAGFDIAKIDSSENDFPKEITQDILKNYGLEPNQKFWKLANSPEARAVQYKLVLIKTKKTKQLKKDIVLPPVKPFQYKENFINKQIDQTDAYRLNSEKLQNDLNKITTQIDQITSFWLLKPLSVLPSMRKLKKSIREIKS